MKNKAKKAKMRKKTNIETWKNHTWCGSFPGPFFTIKLGKNWIFDLVLAHWLRLWPYCIYRNTHIYICAVKLKTGPRFAFLWVKNWSNLFLFFGFYFPSSHYPCRKKRIFEKQAKSTTKKKHIFISYKLVQLCCATYLDQFLTYTWTSS